jgi:hypothetical protein
MMIDAQEHNSFFLADKRIKNLMELLEVLQDPQYAEAAKQHVTDSKNDYANWIRDILKEDILADRISKEKDIGIIASVIRGNIYGTLQTHSSSDAAKEHNTISKESAEPKKGFPRFFDCMKKEFLFGIGIGIIIGITIAVFIKIGAI